MGLPYYATVEQLQAATDYKTAAYEQARLARLLDAASRQVETRLHRRFYPLTAAKTYTDPPLVTPIRVQSSGFWLDDDLLALTAATADSVAQTVADVDLYPASAPYSWAGVTGATIVLTGRWGYSEDTAAAGTLAEDLTAAETAVDVSDSSLIGIGDLIKVGTEQMIVTAKGQLDTGQNLGADIAADVSAVTVGVADGTAVSVGEVILIDSERMLIVDISGNNLAVKRAYDGSTLAAHSSGADVYAPRTLTVERGAVGTTAATHSTSDAIVRNVPPGPIVAATIGEAIVAYEQETSGYAKVHATSGMATRNTRGAGLEDLRRSAAGYRRLRMSAI